MEIVTSYFRVGFQTLSNVQFLNFEFPLSTLECLVGIWVALLDPQWFTQ
jgi:hypothetical protein